MLSDSPIAKKRSPFQTDDPCLRPIHDKVMAHERLTADDALALYRSGDILATGWLANHVRERMHGDVAYFNVNRHINYTNVCVAACRLCAFGRKKDVAGAYTMALEEVWSTAATGYSEAITEFHIVGGLHAIRAGRSEKTLGLLHVLREDAGGKSLRHSIVAAQARRRNRRSASHTESVRRSRAPRWRIDPGFPPGRGAHNTRCGNSSARTHSPPVIMPPSSFARARARSIASKARASTSGPTSVPGLQRIAERELARKHASSARTSVS